MRKKIMLSAVALLSSAVFFVAPAWDMNKLLKQDAFSIMAVEQEDTSGVAWVDTLSQAVITGTRSRTDIRHLPLTVTVVDRPAIEYSYTPSLLPVLTEQVPGFFSTSRGVMGYGVSDGSAGNISVRGLSGGSGQVMVQYLGPRSERRLRSGNGAYRRSSAVHGHVRSSHLGRLSVPDG